MDDPVAAERAAAGLRRRFPDIQIFARARDNPHRLRLETAGATGIVHETHGLSLELGGAVLKAIGENEEDEAAD
jgi:CPA2 family monovalent cation:H+ antiporter-2